VPWRTIRICPILRGDRQLVLLNMHLGAERRPARTLASRFGEMIRSSPSGTLTAPASMRYDDRVSAAKTKAFVAAGQ
jgi:hypothetical protein